MFTHYSITHFLSPINDEISLKACLAPKAAFVLASKDFRKCFYTCVCLVGTENWVKRNWYSALTIK